MSKRVLSALVLGALAVAVQCGGTTAPVEGDAGGSSSGGSSSGGSSSGASSSGGSDSGGSDGAACTLPCSFGRLCCGGACVNTDNDPTNCGGCGIRCSGATPYCDGACKAAPCSTGIDCQPGRCCGTRCCDSGQICCKSEGPVSDVPICFTPTAAQPTCPAGCAPACVSDRNAKTAIVPVDPGAVLEAIERVPISTWAYTSDPSVRHLGPMAQDLHSAFGLGGTDRAYDPIDAHGIAFAAIQALDAKLAEQARRIEALERDNARLRAESSCSPR